MSLLCHMQAVVSSDDVYLYAEIYLFISPSRTFHTLFMRIVNKMIDSQWEAWTILTNIQQKINK